MRREAKGHGQNPRSRTNCFENGEEKIAIQKFDAASFSRISQEPNKATKILLNFCSKKPSCGNKIHSLKVKMRTGETEYERKIIPRRRSTSNTIPTGSLSLKVSTSKK